MDPGDVDLDDLRHLVRVMICEVAEQAADPLRDGLEDDEDLLGRLDASLPPVPRLHRGALGAGGETLFQRP
ncbi:MAG: hypothetical protein L3J96_08025, partial [Thermoplasmata archaeon]|nr:hypothetical protein [Thermoplasmata archaeon]